MESIFKMLI